MERHIFYETTQWHDIGDGIAWRAYKHFGTGVWAGEGLEMRDGDRSGCKRQFAGLWWTQAPVVVEARLYCLNGDIKNGVSSVFSFPGGIGIDQEYFWEIYPVPEVDIERFKGENAERNMEDRIKQLFSIEEKNRQ